MKRRVEITCGIKDVPGYHIKFIDERGLTVGETEEQTLRVAAFAIQNWIHHDKLPTRMWVVKA